MKQTTRVSGRFGAAPGATSNCRFKNELGSSPAMKPIPVQQPSNPNPPADNGHRPSRQPSGIPLLSSLNSPNESPTAGGSTRKPAHVLLSPKTRRRRQGRPTSIGTSQRAGQRLLNHSEWSRPAGTKARMTKAAQTRGSGGDMGGFDCQK